LFLFVYFVILWEKLLGVHMIFLFYFLVPNSMAYLVEPIIINCQKNKPQLYARTDAEKKTEAQILAAKRSLITNLVLIGQSLLIDVTIPLIAPEYLPHVIVFYFTILKGALPILTTIANFGTVANVISQYWAYLKQKIR
jgi:hypothetical protein